AVEQQLQTFADALVATVACATQGKACPRGRLDPGEVAVRPRPADELQVDVMDLVAAILLGDPATQPQQRSGQAGRFFPFLSKNAANEQHQGGRPDRFLTPALEAVGAIADSAALQRRPRFVEDTTMPVRR